MLNCLTECPQEATNSCSSLKSDHEMTANMSTFWSYGSSDDTDEFEEKQETLSNMRSKHMWIILNENNVNTYFEYWKYQHSCHITHVKLNNNALCISVVLAIYTSPKMKGNYYYYYLLIIIIIIKNLPGHLLC